MHKIAKNILKNLFWRVKKPFVFSPQKTILSRPEIVEIRCAHIRLYNGENITFWNRKRYSKNISFDMVKGKLVEENFKGADSFSSVKDIPKTKTFELIARLKKL